LAWLAAESFGHRPGISRRMVATISDEVEGEQIKQ